MRPVDTSRTHVSLRPLRLGIEQLDPADEGAKLELHPRVLRRLEFNLQVENALPEFGLIKDAEEMVADFAARHRRDALLKRTQTTLFGRNEGAFTGHFNAVVVAVGEHALPYRNM